MEEDLDSLDKEKIAQYVLQSGMIKAGVGSLELTWEDLKQLNIQPKNNPLGVRIRVEEDGSVTPTLTFDTKKIKKVSNSDLDNTIENALKDYEQRTEKA